MYQDLIAVESLPPLPATAATLLAMAADPEIEIDKLAGAIERDPPLTAKLLGLANSAFYAPRQPVYAVKDAIVRVLGLNMVRNIAFGMAVTGALSTVACPRFDLSRYWAIALGTADIASGLARAATLEDPPDPDLAYLAGLLHSIGELLLVHLKPEQMNQVLSDAADQPMRDVAELQRSLFGTDQWEVGAFLARHWQLPEPIGDIIAQLGTEGFADRAPPLVTLLSAARAWVVGLVDGRAGALGAPGVDDSYCEYRSSAFIDRFDGLREVARDLGR